MFTNTLRYRQSRWEGIAEKRLCYLAAPDEIDRSRLEKTEIAKRAEELQQRGSGFFRDVAEIAKSGVSINSFLAEARTEDPATWWDTASAFLPMGIGLYLMLSREEQHLMIAEAKRNEFLSGLLIDERQWRELFSSETFLRFVGNDNSKAKELFKKITVSERVQLIKAYLKEYFPEALEDDAVKTAIRRGTLNDKLINAIVRHTRLLSVELRGQEEDPPLSDPPMTKEEKGTMRQHLVERYYRDGYLTDTAYLDFSRSADAVVVIAGDINDFEDFMEKMPESRLSGAFKYEFDEGTVLDDIDFDMLLDRYKQKRREQIATKTDSQQKREKLAAGVREVSPGDWERIKQNFGKLPGWGQLALSAAAAVVIWKSFKALFWEEAKEGEKWYHKITSVLVVAGFGYAAATKLLKGTFVDIFSGPTPAPTAPETPEELKAHKDFMTDFAKYLEQQGEDVDMQRMASSLVLTQVPLSMLAHEYRLTGGGRRGTMKIGGDLKNAILQIALPPQNEVLLKCVEKDKRHWGKALAHVFYLLGVHANSHNERIHKEEILPAVDKVGNDFDAIPDGTKAREEYDRIAKVGILAAAETSMSLQDFISSSVGTL